MVRKLPLPIHERLFAPGTRVYDIQDRVCGGLSEDVGQESAVPSRLPLHRHANKGTSTQTIVHVLFANHKLQAAADKIIREIELFGEDFSGFNAQEEAAHPHPHPAPTATEDDPDRETTQSVPVAGAKEADGARVDKGKKGKVAAKATGLKYQFQIMESIGVPREEIKKFADPYYWLEYFPPICMVRLHGLSY